MCIGREGAENKSEFSNPGCFVFCKYVILKSEGMALSSLERFPKKSERMKTLRKLFFLFRM